MIGEKRYTKISLGIPLKNFFIKIHRDLLQKILSYWGIPDKLYTWSMLCMKTLSIALGSTKEMQGISKKCSRSSKEVSSPFYFFPL